MKRTFVFILLLFLPFLCTADDLYPKWIEFPAIKLKPIDGELQIYAFGTFYFSPNNMQVRFDGLHFHKTMTGEDSLKIKSDRYVLDAINLDGDFEYLFTGHTDDKFQDQMMGLLGFDVRYVEDASAYIGSSSRLVMRLLDTDGETILFQYENASSAYDTMFDQYPEMFFGDNFSVFE